MKTIKKMLAIMLSVVMILGCMEGTFIVSSAEESDLRFYLTEDYRVSGSGVADQSNASLGHTPQIRITEGTQARIVVEAEALSRNNNVAISYAQNGGTLSMKLSALTDANAESGTVLTDVTFTDIQANYYTRLSDIIEFDVMAKEDEKYMAIELSCSGSLDGNSYIDYVELMNKTVLSFSPLSDNILSLCVAGSGTTDGDVIAANSVDTASMSWSLIECEAEGYYKMINDNSGKGMGIFAADRNAGARAVQWTSNESDDQKWRFVKVTKDSVNCYKILNKNSGLVLTVNADGIVTQEKYTKADNQLWTAEILSGAEEFGSDHDGGYVISNISADVKDYVVTYSVAHTKPEEGLLEVELYNGEERLAVSTETTGSFEITTDGVYNIVASIYSDEVNRILLCDPMTKIITVEDGMTNTIEVAWQCTTEKSPWTDNGTITMEAYEGDISETNYIEVDPNVRYQTMDEKPWGGCFADRGWMAMSKLTDEQRRGIVESLYGEDGLRFTAARLPLGNNDYSDTHKSYNEIEGEADYEMEQFSIASDEAYLIPYIKLGLEVNPDIEFFSTPWSPPSWMKQNKKINGVDDLNKLNYTPEVLSAYAKYFVRYLEEYNKLGIDVHAVTPQNEPTMNTPYASCVWTGEQLNEFIRDYLYPAVSEYNNANGKDVEVWLGTFTDSQESFCMPTMTDEKTLAMIDAVCFQWWGAPLSTSLYRNYPGMKLVQSETKCGDGKNNWTYAEEQFDCFKEFLDAGVEQYFLWNMVLDERGANTAARPWLQNAPITVDSGTSEILYRPSYYLTKHFSYYVEGGARRIKSRGSYVDNIAFQNTDGTIIIEVKNDSNADTEVVIKVGDQVITPILPAHSINTFRLQGTYEDTPDATHDLNADPEEAVKLRVKFENKETSDLLSVSNRSTQNDANIIHETNLGESHQLWELVATEEDYYELVNNNSQRLIAVFARSLEENARVVQWDRVNTIDQQWSLEKVIRDGETYYAIINRNSGMALSALQDENATVTQLTYTCADNQLWKATVVSGALPDSEPDGIELSSCEIADGMLKYTLTAGKDISDYDIYTAVYDVNGRMVAVDKNKMSGSFTINAEEEYKIKVIVLEKGTMVPAENPIEQDMD